MTPTRMTLAAGLALFVLCCLAPSPAPAGLFDCLCPCEPPPPPCVAKPDKRQIKKVVYVTKWVPHCVPAPHCGHDDCCEANCPHCEPCARWKRVVLRKEVVVEEVCTYKCVSQECEPAGKDDAAGPAHVPAPAPAPSPLPLR